MTVWDSEFLLQLSWPFRPLELHAIALPGLPLPLAESTEAGYSKSGSGYEYQARILERQRAARTVRQT